MATHSNSYWKIPWTEEPGATVFGVTQSDFVTNTNSTVRFSWELLSYWRYYPAVALLRIYSSDLKIMFV